MNRSSGTSEIGTMINHAFPGDIWLKIEASNMVIEPVLKSSVSKLGVMWKPFITWIDQLCEPKETSVRQAHLWY